MGLDNLAQCLSLEETESPVLEIFVSLMSPVLSLPPPPPPPSFVVSLLPDYQASSPSCCHLTLTDSISPSPATVGMLKVEKAPGGQRCSDVYGPTARMDTEGWVTFAGTQKSHSVLLGEVCSLPRDRILDLDLDS